MTKLLNFQTYGDAADQPTLIIVHGLFGSGRNWRAIAKRLSAGRQVITIDMRNHGDSFWHDDHSYDDLADDLARILSQIGGAVDILGHSMGGKAAMVLALRNPPNLNRLIVADIAPVAYSHTQLTNVEIMQNLDIAAITRRSEADEMLKGQIPDTATRAFLVQNLELSEAGNRWRLNLDALARNMIKIMGFPEITGAFHNDTLFVKGGLSDYILPQHMEKIETLFPNFTVQNIDGAGHWVHAEAPRPFLEAVSGFLASGR